MVEILYEGLGMKITDYPKSPEEHVLEIDGISYILPRGTLEELGREESQGRFRSKMGLIDSNVMPFSRRNRISSEQMQFAFNQAKIKELENQLDEATRRLSEVERQREESRERCVMKFVDKCHERE